MFLISRFTNANGITSPRRSSNDRNISRHGTHVYHHLRCTQTLQQVSLFSSSLKLPHLTISKLEWKIDKPSIKTPIRRLNPKFQTLCTLFPLKTNMLCFETKIHRRFCFILKGHPKQINNLKIWMSFHHRALYVPWA